MIRVTQVIRVMDSSEGASLHMNSYLLPQVAKQAHHSNTEHSQDDYAGQCQQDDTYSGVDRAALNGRAAP